VERILKAVIPLEASDARALESLAGSGTQGNFLEALVRSALTPGMRSYCLRLICHNWHGETALNALLLPQLGWKNPATPRHAFDGLLNRAGDVLTAAGRLAARADDPSLTEALARTLLAFSQELRDHGAGRPAADVALLVLDLEPVQGRIHETAARLALDLARDSGKIGLVALCRGKLAAAVVRAADTDSGRRLEAFSLCEAAVEHFLRAPVQDHHFLASILGPVVETRPYLRKFLVPLFTLLPDPDCPAEIRSVLHHRTWPARITEQSREAWLEAIPDRGLALDWDEEIDRDRLELERSAASAHAMADWTDWTVDHPAYRRAVPHGSSIFREANFEENFLSLSHELTHVYTFVGGLGMALSCLRAAALHTEWCLWARHPGIETEDLAQEISARGVAPIEPDMLDAMLHAERSLELTLKAQTLQDVWTPWCEGLALFGELSADPALDPDCIGPMQHALRDLIDFSPASNAPEAIEQVFAEIEDFIAEFDQRCSTAIEAGGLRRLRVYFEQADVPYLPGYLAVRTVVASWRRTCERPLSATQAFNLLLHATRFGIRPAIPDLSLRSDRFEAEALRLMSDWVHELARLPKEDIDTFFQPIARDERGSLFRWNGMRLMQASDEHVDEEQEALFSARVTEALSSLSRDEDIDRVPGAGEPTRALVGRHMEPTGTDDNVDRCARLAGEMLQLNSMLPIGRTQGKFYLNIDPGNGTGHIGIQFRTTECSAKTGLSSVNSAWFTIPAESAEAIRAHYLDSADPHVEVTRVIDLANTALPIARFWAPHLIAFKYGDWLHVQGTSQATELFFSRQPDFRAHAADMIGGRLYPRGMLAAEVKFIARGDHMARRTRDWIDQSDRFADAADSAPWAALVREKAERVLAGTHRRPLQQSAARQLLDGVGLHRELVDTLVGSSYATLTEYLPECRPQLIDALFRTARFPSKDGAISQLASRLDDEGLTLFAEGPLGWDIVPCGLND
jgi:hypothetical protein